MPPEHKTGAITSGRSKDKKELTEKKGPMPEKEWDILIAFRFIKYIEGEKFLEFNVDPGLKSPTVIHIPSQDKWDKEMPEWARGRRAEILGRVRPKCEHIKPEWREY